jgi:excisionase family DNA binding protein
MPTDSVIRQKARPLPQMPVDASSLLDELMTVDQMADILQMRVSTIEDYARRGLLPSLKVGRHRRFIRSQVEEAIIALADSAVGYARLR